MRTALTLVLFAAAVVSVPPAQADPKADWPHWRGAARNGIVAESSHYKGGAWPLGKEAWRLNVGLGSTSPLVVGDNLYTIGWRGGSDHVVCLDPATGREKWRQSYRARQYGRHAIGDKGQYSGACATPEYDAATGLLYTLGIDGELNCWDTRRRGAKVWGFNLYDRYKAPQRPQVTNVGHRDYGYTTAPLVQGDALIVEVGAPDGAVMAFDKRTGRRKWASENRDPAGHTGGLAPITVQGVPCVAVVTIKHLLVVRLDAGHEGKTVAQFPWPTDYANNIASASVYGDSVLVTSGYNREAICRVRITLQGAQKVWQQPYHSGVCTPVVYRGHVYWAWRHLYCLDFETGELKWRGSTGGGDPGSCIITGDGRIISWTKRGRLILSESADRSPDDYKELARRDAVFRRAAWPHVVLAGGRLFCKDADGNMVCFGLTGR